MDPSKLKVVELRAELAARGLDQKGVKVVLVERLQKALETEGAEGITTPGNESIDQGDSVEHESSEPPDQEDEHVDEIKNIDDQPEEHEEEDDDQNPDNYEVNDEVGEDDVKEEVVASEPNENSSTKQAETIIVVKEEQEKSENEIAKIEGEGENTEEITKDEENKEIKDSPNKDKDLKKSDYSDRKNRKRGRSRSPPRRGDRRSPTRNQPAKNADDFTKEEEEPEINENAVVLSWYDSDLHLEVDPDFVNAKPLSDAALSLAWAGARSTYGIKSGRVLYEVQLTGHNQFYNNFPDEKDLYELRVGWSTQKSNLQLGENALSFSYASSGKKAVNNAFSEYGIRYELDDVVGAYLDLESSPCKIEFTVNGKSQGNAFAFEKSILESEALFPHIISKNTVFRVNFGQVENGMLPLVKPKKPKHSKDAKRDKRDRRDSKRSDHADSERKEKPVKEEEETSKELPKNKAEENKQSEEAEEIETNAEVLNVADKAEIAVDVEMKDLPSEEPAAASLIKETEEFDKKVEDVTELPAILELLEGYIYINTVNEEELVAGPKRPNTRLECEVIMMVGLPGSGKTHWATKHAEENPDKYYNILGNTALIDRMKINGEARRKCHIGKWERLIEWCNRTLIVLQDIATRRRRNFILDQTNVYASAQRRKMRGFGEFKRIAVVVIPEEEEFKQRYDKKIENEGKEVPDTALNEMKANFAMPTTEYGWFTEIRYTDLEGETAQKAIEEFNENGRKALPPPTKRRRFDDRRRDPMRRDRNRWGDRRRNDRYGGGNGSGYDRRGGGSGYDRRDRGWNSGNGSSNWSGGRRGSSSRFDDRRGGSGRDRDRDRREYRPRDRSRGRSSGARDDKKRDSRRVSSDRNRNGGSSNNWSSSGQHWGDDHFGGWGGNFQNQGYGGQTGWANNGWGNWGSNQWGNAQNTSNNTGQWKNYGTSNSSSNPANPQQWMNYWQNDEYRSPTKQ